MQIISASPATPKQQGVQFKVPEFKKGEFKEGREAKPPMARDYGKVTFRILRPENNYADTKIYALTQDDFLRFLILGEDFLQQEKVMPEGKINIEIKGDSGLYRLSIRSLPAPQL